MVSRTSVQIKYITVKKWHSPVQRAVVSGSVDMGHRPASTSNYLGDIG